MENEIKPRINDARRLVAEIARIGGLEPPARCQSDTGSENHQYAGRVLPYSNSDSLEGEVVKVVVANDQAKDNLLAGLDEIKQNLLELCDRQLMDLIDAALSGSESDIEDVDKMLSEISAVYRSMKTLVAIEAAQIESSSA